MKNTFWTPEYVTGVLEGGITCLVRMVTLPNNLNKPCAQSPLK